MRDNMRINLIGGEIGDAQGRDGEKLQNGAGGQTLAGGVQVEQQSRLMGLLDQATSKVKRECGFANLLLAAVYCQNDAHSEDVRFPAVIPDLRLSYRLRIYMYR